MSLLIDLTPTEQKRIEEAARQKGMEPADYIKELVTDHLPDNARQTENTDVTSEEIANHFYFTATREEFNAALDEIAKMNQNMPVLSPAAFDRETLYEDRF